MKKRAMKPLPFGLIWLSLFGIWVLPSLHAQSGASVFLSPSSGTFTVDSTFTVSIHLNTGGNFVNAVEVNIAFPPDKLQVVSPTTGKSLIQVWTAQPSFSNTEGTLKFQGAIPAPGISTQSGLISTVTFRVKNTGTAAVRILDSSRILLNDGKGTDVLSQTANGLYSLALPPPAGPIVISPTNPDQEKWYPAKSVVFRWEASEKTEGFSYVLNDLPVDDPDEISEGSRTSVSYKDLADGVYYFHIKRLREGAWGGVTNYKVQVDNTAPAGFKPQFSLGSFTANTRPIVEFGTTDAASGVDHYELKFISLDLAQARENAQGGETPFFIEATSPYSTKLDVSRYDVVVRAYDRAGNFHQTVERLTITRQIFEVVSGQGIRVAEQFVVGWAYVWIIGAVLLAVFLALARVVWRWHRQIERQLEAGPHGHPEVSRKLELLRAKQSEYKEGGSGNTALLILIFLVGAAFWIAPGAVLAQEGGNSLPLDAPLVTLFPKSLSNDEIFYIGGRTGAPGAKVLIYIQGIESGNTFTYTTLSDAAGAWFYSLPHFLDSGNYRAWTQASVEDEMSPPSSRMDFPVAPTAVQFGENRLSYQDLYFILAVMLAAACAGLLAFVLYHAHHLRRKSRRLGARIKEAEESIRRGFLLLRKDMEDELALVRKVKMNRELSREEKAREEKLVKDFDSVSGYIGKEIWELEKGEEGF
ncbi:hypothetical protein C4587_02995 [Candidatus Parcubacteria bacterium]|nr:MAG: hypothetical protein C4587_02995 [Candidatus Parcubacteria bacterium]